MSEKETLMNIGATKVEVIYEALQKFNNLSKLYNWRILIKIRIIK